MPLSLQIATLLRNRLQLGEWRVGEHMPTLETFMLEYGVSRVTMRMALAELEQEGLIERARGRGTIVIADITKERWLILPTQWHALVSHIHALHARVVERASGWRKPVLQPDEGRLAEAYWYQQRVNWTREAPYSFMTIYLEGEVYERHPERYRHEAVLPVFDKAEGKRLAAATQVLTITTADVEIATALQLKVGAPIGEVRRIVRNRRQEVLYLAEAIYPARNLRVETNLLPT